MRSWNDFTGMTIGRNWLHGEDGFIEVNGHRMPYAVFENEDDVTTGKPDLLGARLEKTLGLLWYLRKHS